MSELPPRLAEIVGEFQEVDRTERLDLLFEYAGDLPDLPARFEGQTLERVDECQTPLFVHAEVEEGDVVRLFFAAPDEAPTSKGFAGIIFAGLDGCTVDEVLGTPSDFASGLGLAKSSPPCACAAWEPSWRASSAS